MRVVRSMADRDTRGLARGVPRRLFDCREKKAAGFARRVTGREWVFCFVMAEPRRLGAFPAGVKGKQET